MNEPNDTAPDEGTPRRANELLERQRLEWLHERSGEVELLISAALLFGLMQLPGRLEATWDAFNPTLTEGSSVMAFLLYFYVRVMAVTLIGAFALHLVTRAYWVGLVGLDSVFPEGVDWDRVNYGPVAKGVYRERAPKLPQMIRRADDFGSMIFSVAFLIITMFVFSIVFGFVGGAVSWVLNKTILPGVEVTTILIALALTLGLLPALAIGTERAMGDRLDPEGRLAGLIRSVVAGYYKTSGGGLYLPIQFVLFSRIKKTVVWPAALTVMFGLVTTLLVTEISRGDGLRLAADARLPAQPGRRAVLADHFADSRAQHATAPYIQSDIIDGPYVRLTVPLVAASYLARLDAACPDLPDLGESGFVTSDVTVEPVDADAEDRLLTCLGQIWSVQLNGQPLQLSWDLAWSRRGPDALVGYIPTDGLSSGAHLLEITRMPRPDEDEGSADDAPREVDGGGEEEDENPPARYFIRFRI